MSATEAKKPCRVLLWDIADWCEYAAKTKIRGRMVWGFFGHVMVSDTYVSKLTLAVYNRRSTSILPVLHHCGILTGCIGGLRRALCGALQKPHIPLFGEHSK